MLVISMLGTVLAGALSFHEDHRYPLGILILANFVPVIAVFRWDWGLFTVLFLYWTESVVILFYSIPKLLFLGDISEGDESLFMTLVGGVVTVYLFARMVGYIAFVFGVLVFVFGLFNKVLGSGEFVEALVQVFQPAGGDTFRVGVGAFFLGHGASFLFDVWNYDRGDVNVGEIIAEPYLRTIYMVVAIIVMAIFFTLINRFGIIEFDQFELPIILVVVVLKIVIDAVSYVNFHS